MNWLKSIPSNVYRLLGYAGGALVIFTALRLSLSPNALIILLNGLFVGGIISVFVSFSELATGILVGRYKYSRVEHTALALFLAYLALLIGASSSIYIRITDLPTTSLTSVAFSRYLAILSAVGLVMAQDFGLGIFHGRDRRFMFTALCVGLVVALVLIVLQVEGSPAL